MCGLVGVAGKSDVALEKMFRVMLILDTVRGEHSTGVLLVDTHGDTFVHKAVGNPYELFDSRKYTSDLRYQNTVMMGHNRYATSGAVNKTNAHPFEHGHLIGAHNGTLSTKPLLDDHKDYVVDSDNLYHHMEKNGTNNTCKILGGHFALSWYNRKDNTINFVRNETRPLFYAFTKNKKNVVWASEKWMIEVAAQKAFVKLGRIMDLPVHKHHSLHIPTHTMNKYPNLSKFTVNEVEAYIAPKKPTLVVVNNTDASGKKKKTELGMKNTLEQDAHFKLLNTTVEFTAKGTHPMYKHMIEVVVMGHKDVMARIVCKAKTKLHKELVDNPGVLYKGKVCRVSTNSAWVLAISSTSVEEVAQEEASEGYDWAGDELWDEEVPDGRYQVGFPSKLKTPAEWTKAVQCGCSWCDDVPQELYEAKRLVWFSQSEFVCPHCAADVEIKKYLHL